MPARLDFPYHGLQDLFKNYPSCDRYEPDHKKTLTVTTQDRLYIPPAANTG